VGFPVRKLTSILSRRNEKCLQKFGRIIYPIGRPWRKWEDNIRMNLWETAWKGVNWMTLA